MTNEGLHPSAGQKGIRHAWLYDLLLVVVLAGGMYFRVTGLNWDQDQHLHPDERFLTMVESNLQVKKCRTPNTPVEACPPEQKTWIGPGDYFDTAASTLNPHNRGFGYFVYGTLPIFIVRYITEFIGQAGYDKVHLVGRQISALSDLLAILLMYLIAARLYDRRTALLGAAFSALAVLQIQQSHFFTVDTVANFFIFLAIFFATEIMLYKQPEDTGTPEESVPAARSPFHILSLMRDPLFRLCLGFGVSLGMAIASKLNAVPLAALLPFAFVLRHFNSRDPKTGTGPRALNHVVTTLLVVYLISGAFASILAFRVFQPYAFRGLGLNPAWVANIREISVQSTGDVDVPFALQWARRSHLFSFENLTTWGLGLPLGILAWLGFLVMGWRILKGESRHLLLWGWTALYFGWQSLAFNPTMRYQLPIYPLLSMMGGWLVIHLWDMGRSRGARSAIGRLESITAVVAGAAVLVLTLAWAFAFTRIYTWPVTRVAASYWIYQNIPAAINLHIRQADNGVYQQPVPFPNGGSIQTGAPFLTSFRANADGDLTEVYFPHVLALGDALPQTFSLGVSLKPDSPPDQLPATASFTSNFSPTLDVRGRDYTLTLSRSVPIVKDQVYYLRLESSSALTLVGTSAINETDWDDGLPLRLGPQAYDGYGGIYQGGLNLQLYWDDTPDKLKLFEDTLSKGDIIFISSNRQWATTTRVPERYPLTTAYYRALIGCPAGKDVIWCYNVGKPGMFEGQLGFKLTAVFESFPTLDIPVLGQWQANDQFAEEAFTVYDHPKVLIFQKSADFSAVQVQSILGAVDLTHVVHLTPRQAGRYKDLMLSPDALASQQAGGTWSQLFSYDSIQNRFPVVGLLLWYVFVLLLGLVTYPIVRFVLPGLGDRGYPLARTLGLVILAYGSWLAGSLGVPVTRVTIVVVLALLTAASLGLGWMRRAELTGEWTARRKYFLMIEGLILAFFIFDLLVRIGNPDLWHPSKGGERPMDFSYFNAILKSTTFPPYDPWFAGGTINYYYYGFVLMAMPVKLLGIVPTIAYNFILPTLFALVAISAFCVGWNVAEARRDGMPASGIDARFVAGLLAALLMVVLGNLGTVQMLYQGFERMAAPGGLIDNANILQRAGWAVQGVAKALTGQPLPYGPGEWYWNPSRVIPPGPGNEITEFPYFTFLYSDLHAHMMVLPLALFVIGWAVSTIRARRTSLVSLAFGALVIGALYPTNLSDIYTYLPLGFAALAYAIWFYFDVSGLHLPFDLPIPVRKLVLILGSIGLLTVLSFVFYQPYRDSYSQGYSALDPWTAAYTPLGSYLTHWGVFLFLVAAWMVWETRDWMASTPVSALNKLRPYNLLIEAGLAAFLAGLVYFALRGVQVGWVAWPMVVWAGVLLLRPDQSDMKRAVLFMIGTSFLITLVVELEVVRGDIGRMNTVFKFYLQAWTMLSVCAAAAFAWLLPVYPGWSPRWRALYQTGAILLLSGAFLFTVTATSQKIIDRMAIGVPLTLDSMTYMQYAQYGDFGVMMDLSHDYRAIRWMQDNVRGSPVIVEANTTEYKWGTRFTIYTGLPGVIGWNWHQRQQRALIAPNLITDRIDQIAAFYSAPDPQAARDFLKKYDVRYIILGQLERAEYPGPGLDKFEQYNGRYWNSVYRDGDTVIYQVNP